MPDEPSLFLRFGVALLLGILVGLQREFAFDEPGKELATGVRTFALMSMIGCAAALAAEILNSPGVFVGIILVPSAFIGINYAVDATQGRAGLTTEISAVLTMLIGALCFWNQLTLAVAVGVSATFLLSMKLELHDFAHHITRIDLFATLKFAVISAIILPILPNRTYGPPPFDVFNPFTIWLLVVFISGISFVGYILIKIIGARRGIGLTGLLGGLASSTAVTLSFAQRSRNHDHLGKYFATAVIVAWVVMFFRVLVEVAAVNPRLLSLIWTPILATMGAGLIYCLYLYKTESRYEEISEVVFSNPFNLASAIHFAMIFLAIMAASRIAQVYLGDTGVYLSSIVSGLADVDAIALSVAQLSKSPEGIELNLAARAVVLAATANTLAKGCIVIFSGSANLKKAVIPGFVFMMVTGCIIVFTI